MADDDMQAQPVNCETHGWTGPSCWKCRTESYEAALATARAERDAERLRADEAERTLVRLREQVAEMDSCAWDDARKLEAARASLDTSAAELTEAKREREELRAAWLRTVDERDTAERERDTSAAEVARLGGELGAVKADRDNAWECWRAEVDHANKWHEKYLAAAKALFAPVGAPLAGKTEGGTDVE